MNDSLISNLVSDIQMSGQVLVCSVSEGAGCAVWSKAGGSGKKDKGGVEGGLPRSSWFAIEDVEQGQALMKKVGVSCQVVLTVPRSRYLVREFVLPVVADDEVTGMVSLEAEAAAPPGVNEIEVAYRTLGDPDDGQQRYEVFYARRSDLSELLEWADALGLSCDHVIPNSVLLSWLFANTESPRALVYESTPEQLELASQDREGRIAVRPLGSMVQAQARIPQVVGELMRSGQMLEVEPGDQVSVHWLGEIPTEEREGDETPWIDCQALTLGHSDNPDSIAGENQHGTYLGMLGLGLLDPGIRKSAREVDLMPQARRQSKLMRRVVMSGIWTCSGFVAALLLVSLGLWLLAGRYEDRRDQLAQKVSEIEDEGRQVSFRIDQLNAMHDSWDRRNLMRDVLAALYEASPEGVVYHQVEVKEDGSCYLRGQAQSVALPFELPERLDAQAIFTDVTLTDAGQARRGAGSVTEFRIDCRVVIDRPRNSNTLTSANNVMSGSGVSGTSGESGGVGSE